MEEGHEIGSANVNSAEWAKPWQFSLRTIFILTTLCALYFSLAAQFPTVLLVSCIVTGIVIFQTAVLSIIIGITVGLETVIRFCLKRLQGKNRAQFSLRTIFILTFICAACFALGSQLPTTFQFLLPLVLVAAGILVVCYLVN